MIRRKIANLHSYSAKKLEKLLGQSLKMYETNPNEILGKLVVSLDAEKTRRESNDGTLNPVRGSGLFSRLAELTPVVKAGEPEMFVKPKPVLLVKFYSTRKIRTVSSEKTDYTVSNIPHDGRHLPGKFTSSAGPIPWAEMQIIVDALIIPEVKNITIRDQHGNIWSKEFGV
jgi:hypothetical protein